MKENLIEWWAMAYKVGLCLCVFFAIVVFAIIIIVPSDDNCEEFRNWDAPVRLEKGKNDT